MSSYSSIFLSISYPPLSLLCLHQEVFFFSHLTFPGSPSHSEREPRLEATSPPSVFGTLPHKDSLTKESTAEEKRIAHNKGKNDGE